jgi:hypothetical protein
MDTDTVDRALDASFISGAIQDIPGWLNNITGAATLALLRTQQDELACKLGHFVEIGTYAGKYLAVLAHFATVVDAKVLSLDPFFHFTERQVTDYVTAAVPTVGNRVITKKGFSQELDSAQIADLLGVDRSHSTGCARLAHIDGSHEYDDVLWDLRVVEPLLNSAGLLVVDDIFSPGDIGVTEALFRFQHLAVCPLAPIAYVSNKLFLCRHQYAQRYRAALERFLLADTFYQETKRFRERLTTEGAGRRMVETKLFGLPYLVV